MMAIASIAAVFFAVVAVVQFFHYRHLRKSYWYVVNKYIEAGNSWPPMPKPCPPPPAREGRLPPQEPDYLYYP
jgi:hypothetical protein